MASKEISRLPRREGLCRNALFRLAVMGISVMAWLVGFKLLAIPALRDLSAPGTLVGDSARLLGAAIYAAGGLLLYRFLVRKVECRQPVELAHQPGVSLGFLGFGIGLALCSAVVGTLWLVGAAEPTGLGQSDRVIAQFAAAIMASVGEEMLFRAILFRILEQAMGTLRALIASALLFGLAHIVNPDATLASSLVISLESGVMLGLAYVATRNLWFPIGIHLAWNFAQGGIFGAAGSSDAQSLVQMTFFGPVWLTGGPTGTDMSAVTISFCVALALAFAFWARRRKHWEPARLMLRLA